MFLTELAEPQLLVIYPGRFQPFHKGHYAVYNWLTGKFGRNNVWIATSNKTDNLKSPFSFAEKSYFMQLTGVPADRIIQASQPYQIQNVLTSGQISVANPDNTVVIFAVSEKDMAEDPRFSFDAKKDGSPSYFQPLTDIKNTVNMKQHGYILTVPTFDFKVSGQEMRSASEIRAKYADSDEPTRQHIIKDLFGRYTREAEQIMNSKLSPVEKLPEPKYGRKTKLDKVTAEDMSGGYRLPSDDTDSPISGANKKELGESIYYQGYQVDLDPVRKELIVSRGGQVLHREKTNLVGRPASASTIKARLSTIIDKLEDDKFPDDLEMREDSQADRNARIVAGELEDARAQGNQALVKQKEQELQKLGYYINPQGNLQPLGMYECAGVGVVKGGNDPRYVMATIGDQNDVGPETLGKEMRAYFPTKAPKTGQKPVGKNIGKGIKESEESNITKLARKHIEWINQDIDRIKGELNNSNLPSTYKEKLKEKIKQLEQERAKLVFY